MITHERDVAKHAKRVIEMATAGSSPTPDVRRGGSATAASRAEDGRVSISETARFAWQGVTANKSRSALTTLGIMIGVAAVIVLVAVGTGSSKAVQDQINSLGSNTLTVQPSSTAAGGRSTGGGFPGGGFSGPPGATSNESTTQNATQTRTPELTLADAKASPPARSHPPSSGRRRSCKRSR